MSFTSWEEERRFTHALLASLLLHVLVLGWVKGVEPLRKAGYAGVLSVSFRALTAPQAPPEVPAPATPRRAATITDASRRSLARVAATPQPVAKPVPAAKPMQASPTPPRARPAEARPSSPPARTSRARAPGVVDVLLIVGADGHPSGIYWDHLPALTNAQFQQLEAIIRRQTYPSTAGARLTQEIDVFALLGIGRGAPPPAPPSSGAGTSAP